ncbi:MAG: thymidylate synthase [Nanoarchaeota archaeon]
MRYFTSHTVNESFNDIIQNLMVWPEYIVNPRNQEVREIKDCVIEIDDPMSNLYVSEHRNSPLTYIAAELLWYFSGTNDPTFIENYASLWKRIHNKDGTVNSAYGNLIFREKNTHGLNQYEWVIESLKRDKDTRQAFMHFNKPEHQDFGIKDQVCTLQALFHIRDEKLYMTIDMRSNDVIYGFMTDWAFFSVLQYHVYLHMLSYYPKLKMGSYTHISHSMHLYDRHYELANKILKSPGTVVSGLPFLSEPVLSENGQILSKYRDVFDIVLNNKIEKIENITLTKNPLIDWCIKILKEDYLNKKELKLL